MRCFQRYIPIIVAAFALGPTVHAQSGEWTGDFALPGVTGPVYALVGNGDRIYVGGSFAYAGSETTSSIGVYDSAQEVWEPVGGGVNGLVNALEVGNDGALYAGGQFSAAGGVPAANIARFDPNTGEWTPLGEGIEGFDVRTLAFGPDGSLYAGGEFDTAGGVAAKNLARWDGGEWEAVGEVGSGFSYVTSLAYRSGYLYVGGNFEVAGGVAARNVARYDLATEMWKGLGGGADANVLAEVRAIAVNEEGVFIGGTLDEAIQPDGSVLSINNVAQWDPEAEEWSALGEGTERGLNALTFDSSGKLYAAGEWENDVLRRWDGQMWEVVNLGPTFPQPGASISTLLAVGDRLIIGHGGAFLLGGINPNSFVYLYEPAGEASGVLSGTETDGFTDDVHTLASAPGGDVFAGGIFHFAGTQQIDYVAHWDGAAWEPLGQGVGRMFSGSVENLFYSRDGSLYVGGRFDEVFQSDGAEVASKSVARWDGQEWEGLGRGLELGAVRALAEADDGAIYVGGLFLEVVQEDGERLDVQSLARWNPSTGRWEAPPEGHGFDGVEVMIVDEAGALYVGGYRIVAGSGESRARVARLDPQTEQWTVLREWAFTFSVEDLAVVGNPTSGGSLYAAPFTEGVWRWRDNVWESLGGLEVVRSLALNGDPEVGGELYAGGLNQNSSGPYVQRWDGTNWSGLGSGLTGFVSPPLVYALAVGEAETEGQVALWVGGEFVTAGGAPSSCIARWETENHDTAAEDGASAEAFGLEAYPNPTTGATTFRYVLATAANVRLVVYDVLGREVAVLVDAEQPPGTYEAPFEQRGLAAGVYVVRMEAGLGTKAQVLTRRVTLVR